MFENKSAWRRAACIAMLFGLFALSGQPAIAQATYTYTGNAFTLFSCGPSDPGPGTIDCSTPAPTNPDTSYTATDHITATLTLESPLGPNFAFSDVSGSPGFALTLNDGQHTVSTPIISGQGLFAFVSTDTNGNINHWRLGVNTGGFDNGGIITFNFSDVSGTHIFDWGTLSCCDPSPPGNFAQNFGIPGTWSGAGPIASVTNLMNLVSSPSLGLTSGQTNSLTDKLSNILASVQAGLYRQAINQLNAFINSVESSIKNNKISPQTGDQLISAAQAIVLLLS